MAYRTIQSDNQTFDYNGYSLTDADGNDLTYDENGQLITGIDTSLVWNWDGKLRSAAKSNTTINLKYDPAGNRISKDVNDGQTVTARKYIVDIVGDLPTVLLEIDDSNDAVKKTYIYANSQILAEHNGGYTAPRYFYLHDRLGSVRQVIDSSAVVVRMFTFNPFGETIEDDGSFYTPWRFSGQFFDDEIDQYHLRARQYYPYIGRFISRDPVFGKPKNPITLHRYLYCGNNPINFTDPDGREIRLGWAQVQVGRSRTEYLHTLLHIIPENQSRYFTAGNAEYYDPDTGKMSFTIQAGPSNMIVPGAGYLKARLLGARDDKYLYNDLTYQYRTLNLKGKNEDYVIDKLVLGYFAYKDRERELNYDMFPSYKTMGYSCNSFTAGLLNHAGLDDDIDNSVPQIDCKAYKTPGWDKPVPFWYFEDD